MPFALIVIGLILIVTGARNTYKEFASLFAGEFTGDKNFVYWIVAIGAVGALGYSETLKPFSRAFLALILISMIIANKGLFDKFTRAINTTQTATPAPMTGQSVAANENNSDANGSNIVSDVVGYVGNNAAKAAQVFLGFGF